MVKLKELLKNKTALILATLLVVVVSSGVIAYSTFVKKSVEPVEQVLEEVDLAFDPEGPYALLTPRRDGNALVLNIKRTASYKEISYDLAYSDEEGIDRGVSGTIDIGQGKSEYTQEILFGTCSKNVCKYDKGVENGTLTLHITKDNQIFKMITQWHLQKPEVALGILTSGDNHFSFTQDPKTAAILPPFTIINELTGVPKLPDGKKVVGKVYALNPASGSSLASGEVSIELADAPPPESKIFIFKESENRWDELKTTTSGSTLKSTAPTDGIFAVLTPAS